MVKHHLFSPGTNWQQFPRYQVHLLSQYPDPFLEIEADDTEKYYVPFVKVGTGRKHHEDAWQADFRFPLPTSWKFRLMWQDGRIEKPKQADYYQTQLRTLWMQDGQVFSYAPAAAISPSRVIKLKQFEGSLPARPIYIYLPRGYDTHPQRHYPVLYMHDGQNCFAHFAHDSYSGAWKADLAADRLIHDGQMAETIIVGVSNGREQRIAEYLPPFATFNPSPTRRNRKGELIPDHITGRADKTMAYYQNEIAPYIAKQYRVQRGREHTATIGSSMGGLFTTYIAWAYPDFAQHHAALSPSYWVTQNDDKKLQMIQEMRHNPLPDIRFWLDSGTENSPGRGSDAKYEVLAAKQLLLNKGWVEGDDFQCYIEEGGIHDEASWGRRLNLILPFLFPANHPS